jgi:hypothetical protein
MSVSYAKSVYGWRQTLIAIEGNATDLPEAEIARQKLQAILDSIQEASQEQAIHTAAKQEATNRINVLLTEGWKVATVLRTTIRHHYGNRSEKLAEFNLQPFRGRKRKAAPAPEEATPE